MALTEEGIMAQIWIAFGQGVGAIRVSQEAVLELRRWCFDAVTPRVTNEEWETQAIQVLDRFRAIGSLAASKAASAGAPAITPREVAESVSALLEALETDLATASPSGSTANIGSPRTSDRQTARRTEVDRSIRLSAALATAPTLGAEISNLEFLDDSALLNAAQTRMPTSDSERMEELHRRQRLTGLSEVEAEELARLEQQYERVILVRSHSTSLLEKRGHDIRSLTRRLAPGG